jgi:hypothetical protein
MKTLAVLLSGVAFGALGMFVAQGYADQGRPGVYVVGEYDVGDPGLYAKEWSPKAVEISKRHGAIFIATGGLGNAPTAGGNKLTPLDDETRAATPGYRRMVITGYPN